MWNRSLSLSLSRQSSQRNLVVVVVTKTTSHLNIGLIYCMYRWLYIDGIFIAMKDQWMWKKYSCYQTLLCEYADWIKLIKVLLFFSFTSTNLHNSFMIYSNNKVRKESEMYFTYQCIEKEKKNPSKNRFCERKSEM